MTPRSSPTAGLRYDVDGAGRHDHPRPARGAQRPDPDDVAGAGRDRRGRSPTTSGSSSCGARASVLGGPGPRDARPRRRRRRGDGRRPARRLDDEEMSATIDDYQQGFTFLRDPRFVSIAAVQGYAIGAGFQLALSCDLRVVADDAQFCMKESALGPGAGPDGNKTAGRERWLRQGTGDLRDRADGRGRGGRGHRAGARPPYPPTSWTPRSPTWSAALTAPMAGCGDARPRRCCRRASEPDLDDQRRLEREAQVRRFRELAALMGWQPGARRGARVADAWDGAGLAPHAHRPRASVNEPDRARHRPPGPRLRAARTGG